VILVVEKNGGEREENGRNTAARVKIWGEVKESEVMREAHVPTDK
jgi:hypothetical protein